MTRINAAIKPVQLTDQHLLAELRELPRIFTAVAKRIEDNKSFNDIPNEFKLGENHVKFFYNKCLFLYKRHSDLRSEYKQRFNKEYDFDESRLNIPNYLYKDYTPTFKDKVLLIDRISTRITESNQIPRYYGKPISKSDAINILKNKC